MKHILAAMGIIIGGVAMIKDLWSQGKIEGYGEVFVRSLTGYSMKYKKWQPQWAHAGIPLVAGVGGSYVAAKTGVNQYTPKGWNL